MSDTNTTAADALHNARDWPEDFPHENGNYMCKCHSCDQTFMGYKRRVTCKVCHAAVDELVAASAPTVPATPDAFMVVLAGGEPVSLHFQEVNAKRKLTEWDCAGEIVPLVRFDSPAVAAPVEPVQAPRHLPAVLELPEGDPRTARVVYSDIKDGKHHLCIVVEPEPVQAQPVACSAFKCEAARADGVLCADEQCDIAAGVRTAPQLVAVPHDVQRALDRMCKPLCESRLDGVTAKEDARCMAIIKRYIEGAIMPSGSVKRLGARLAELLDEDQWADVEQMLNALAGPAHPAPIAVETIDTDEFKFLSEFWAGKAHSSLDVVRVGHSEARRALIAHIDTRIAAARSLATNSAPDGGEAL